MTLSRGCQESENAFYPGIPLISGDPTRLVLLRQMVGHAFNPRNPLFSEGLRQLARRCRGVRPVSENALYPGVPVFSEDRVRLTFPCFLKVRRDWLYPVKGGRRAFDPSILVFSEGTAQLARHFQGAAG